MLERTRFGGGTLLLATLAIGCATSISVTPAGAGGSGGGDDVTSSSSGGAGGEALDAGPDVMDSGPPGPCVYAVDCAFQSDVCNVGACVNGTCTKMPANEFGSCDDGQFCTINDICQSGICTGGTPKGCPAADACHVGVCDEATKGCKSVAGNDGVQCDDKDPCTGTGVCAGGACAKGPQNNCSFLDTACAVGACDPVVGCKAVPANENGACDDNLFCTIEDHCQNAVCVGGAPNPCAPPGGCFIATCDENTDSCSAVPGNDGAPCDDLNLCTAGTVCLAGVCGNGVPANDGALCDSGSSCATSTTCTAGVCGGGTGPEVYFSDDFHDSSKGWILGPEWQIGSAQASQGGAVGADPDTDHTPSADNGIAGVVIGGNEDPVVHPFYYLESPPFNTATATGPVILGFQRWLNSDYDPFMHNAVEVYNGTQWIVVWESGAPPSIEDSPPVGTGWTFQQFDLTSYKNAAMKVRFGYDIAQSGVFSVGSWNIDDVLVAGAACP